MTRHESPPVLTDGTWTSNGRVSVWLPAPPPDTRRRCRDCNVVIGPRVQLCDPCRDESRRRNWSGRKRAGRRAVA